VLVLFVDGETCMIIVKELNEDVSGRVVVVLLPGYEEGVKSTCSVLSPLGTCGGCSGERSKRGIVRKKMDAKVEDEEMGVAIKKTQKSRWGHWDRYG
jgi:hypothetical protein